MTTQATKQPQDHKRGKKNPVVKVAVICNDTELADRHAEVKEKVELYKQIMRRDVEGRKSKIPEDFDQLVADEADLLAQVHASSFVFKFRSIGHKAMDKILSDNPPTEAQVAQVVKEGGKTSDLTFDPEAAGPILCEAACLDNPTDQTFQEIWDSPDWNDAELGALFSAALEAQRTRRVLQMGNGSSGTRSFG